MSPTRRNVLLIGATAAAGGAALGSGAFDQVAADRTATVNVVGDESAYLNLSPNDDSPHAELNDNNVLVIDVGDLPDNSDNGDGQGVNEEGITRFNNLFTVTNQGTDDVGVTITPNTDNGGEDPDVVFFDAGGAESSDPGTDADLGGAESVDAKDLEVGEGFIVGLEVDTRGEDNVEDLDQVEVEADVDDFGGGSS